MVFEDLDSPETNNSRRKAVSIFTKPDIFPTVICMCNCLDPIVEDVVQPIYPRGSVCCDISMSGNHILPNKTTFIPTGSAKSIPLR